MNETVTRTAEATNTAVLTKKDITKVMLLYYSGAEVSNSYERLQSLVFCSAMIPVLKKLYPDATDLSAALQRHLIFFNSEATMGIVIYGIVIAMEEEKSQGGHISDAAITSIKTGLMGPLAGMGDAIVWAAIMPIIIGLFLPFAQQGLAIGGIMPLILYPAITISLSYYLIHKGYRLGKASITSLLHGGNMQSIIFTANVIGLMMMGALSASYVKITTPFVLSVSGEATVALQEIFDMVLPGLLPLSAVFSMYWFLTKKGPRYNILLLSVVIFSLLTSFLGIL
jgi:D-glucosaminate-specific PTS system IID component